MKTRGGAGTAGNDALKERRSILIVEDERIVALDLQESLCALGYDAYAIASSAEEAVAKASDRCPDLVLMDIRIKGERDGIETARMLRERFLVPAIFLTAHADDSTIERAKRTSPYGYLLKPVRASELRSAIEVALYRHEHDKRLSERERWYATTLRSMGDAVIAVDLGGNVTFMNPAAEALTGTRIDDALGTPASDVIKLAGGVMPPLERALRERTTVHVAEAALTDGAARERLITDSAAPLVDSGELLGAVMVFRDVTEQKRERQQLELTDRLASLGSMAAGVAHEVNNPLAVVLGNASDAAALVAETRSKLESGTLSLADATELLRELELSSSEVQMAAKRIEHIVADLRMFARPSNEAAGRADVARAIAWAQRSTTREVTDRGRLSVTLEGSALYAAIDELRLGQVLVNLLVNAAQAIAPGAAESNSIELSARAHGEQIIIEVTDTGCGIAPEVRAHLFEPFFTTKPRGVGTGLGLAICHGIVRHAGGQLEVESTEGKGSTFRVTLPRAVSRPSSPAPALKVSSGGSRVLVVDDDQAILRVLRRMLRRHEVVCASGASEALRALVDGPAFDVVLCDIAMPDMNGVDLYEQLLAQQPDVARRFVFMTAGVDNQRVQDFRRSVKNPFLDKPFSPQALFEAFGPLLSRSEHEA